MDRVEIKVAGHLDIDWEQWFHDFTVTHVEGGETILEGPVKDQSDLYGFIAKLRDLGVKLHSVNLSGGSLMNDC
jgi:hypothetical protein